MLNLWSNQVIELKCLMNFIKFINCLGESEFDSWVNNSWSKYTYLTTPNVGLSRLIGKKKIFIPLMRRRVLQDDSNICVRGCGFSETAVHLFLGCNMFGGLWSFIWKWLDITTTSFELHAHFLQFGHYASLPHSSHSFFRLIWLASVWTI